MARNADGQIELVLENRQLLVIFLGMVALWGVFFSLGYIVGRNTSSSDAAVSSPDSAIAASAAKPSPMPPAAYLNRPPEESAGVEGLEGLEGREGLTAPKPELNFDQSAAEPAPEATLTAPQAAGSPSPAATPPPEPPRPPAVAPPSPAPRIMLQVSALSRQEDAQSLVRLLRERNLPVSVTTDATDSLYHVLVGPYQTEREAQEVKRLLENDGFQPFLKR